MEEVTIKEVYIYDSDMINAIEEQTTVIEKVYTDINNINKELHEQSTNIYFIFVFLVFYFIDFIFRVRRSKKYVN